MLRLWILTPDAPFTDDRAYVFGYLKHVFDDVMVTRVARDAMEVAPPPRRPDVVLNVSLARSYPLLLSIEAHALAAGAALSPPTRAAWCAEDKRTYLEDFADLCPPSRIARDIEDVCSAFEDFGGDIVVKDPFGERGRGTERISSRADLGIAEAIAAAAVGPTRELVVQPFMSGFLDGDRRIITQRTPGGGLEIIGHIMRKPAPGDWKCNLSSGGLLELSELTDAECEMAMEIASRTGLDNTAMDIAAHAGRLYYIEHNAAWGGIIDHDLGRGARGVEKIGTFLRFLAERGRPVESSAPLIAAHAS